MGEHQGFDNALAENEPQNRNQKQNNNCRPDIPTGTYPPWRTCRHVVQRLSFSAIVHCLLLLQLPRLFLRQQGTIFAFGTANALRMASIVRRIAATAPSTTMSVLDNCSHWILFELGGVVKYIIALPKGMIPKGLVAVSRCEIHLFGRWIVEINGRCGIGRLDKTSHSILLP